MRLSEDFLVHTSGEETVLVPAGDTAFSGIIKGNKTFGAILELLSEDITEEEIVSKLKERFEAPEELIEKDVKNALEVLGKTGALDE